MIILNHLMRRPVLFRRRHSKPTYWQQIFEQSKVNGAVYNGELLPRGTWEWPKNTYLSQRMKNRQAKPTPPVADPS
jgi:hypothetical protein